MRVLLSVCCCLTVASAGIIGYPLGPLGYDTGYIGHPYTTYYPRPFLPAYPGPSYSYQFVIGPSAFPPNIFPGGVILTSVPGVVPFPPPLTPEDDMKGKGDKKPKDKKDKDDNDKKEDTTEMPNKDESNEDEKSEVEELAE